jgi:hypothetical protein
MSLLAALFAATGLLVGTPVKVTLVASTHAPRVNTHWKYSVHVTSGGKPVAARITVQIVDPLGGVHPVEFGLTTKKVVRFPFRGVFRDFVIWPPGSRGIPLTLRVTVVAGKDRRVLRYAITSHS